MHYQGFGETDYRTAIIVMISGLFFFNYLQEAWIKFQGLIFTKTRHLHLEFLHGILSCALWLQHSQGIAAFYSISTSAQLVLLDYLSCSTAWAMCSLKNNYALFEKKEDQSLTGEWVGNC